MCVAGLEHRIHRLEDGAETILQDNVIHRLQKRLVVLVDEDNNIVQGVDDIDEAAGQVVLRGCDAVLPLPLHDMTLEHGPQSLFRRVVASVEVEVQDWVLFPVVFQFHDAQAFEQVTLTLEVCL